MYACFSTKYIHSKIIKIISFMLFQFRSSLFIILLLVELTGRLLGRFHSCIFMPDLHCIIIMPANVCPFDTPSSFTPMSKFICFLCFFEMLKYCLFWFICDVVLHVLSSSMFWSPFSCILSSTIADKYTNDRKQTLTRKLMEFLEMITFFTHKKRPWLNDRYINVHAIFWIRNTNYKKH